MERKAYRAQEVRRHQNLHLEAHHSKSKEENQKTQQQHQQPRKGMRRPRAADPTEEVQQSTTYDPVQDLDAMIRKFKIPDRNNNVYV